ncbi:hypothetical protein NGM36_16270 [Streptomyces mutabilis]|uniref:hypothetical protein n=1 Tax=Streptomyces mutabilis TaxID=67332 RepID=UPI0022BA2B4C|nr:hypothetical protein [Streptomyces mutabilis]MCZ9351327.1 hypothetical protein [Streptomyces mutabilis]
MPLTRTRQTLKDVVTARLGWRRAYTDATEVAAVLDTQTETAYRQATNSGLVIGQHDSALVMQPDVLDIRSRVLADTFHLENLLDGARTYRMPTELIQHLEAAVRHGLELSTLLADTTRSTAEAHLAGH